jgi:ABC-type phosphate transport system substrate-binding protein
MHFVKIYTIFANIKQGECQMRRIRFCLVCLLLGFTGTVWADVVIIAHKDVAETALTEKDLQKIFLGKQVQWQDTSAIHPATVKEAELHKAFLEQYIKKSSSQWVTHWKRMVFTGNGTPPEQFANQQELLDYVTKTRGAIGYVDAEFPIENVIILEIQQ